MITTRAIINCSTQLLCYPNKEADSLSNYAYTMSYPESHKNEPNNTLEDKSEGSEGYRVCGFIIE